MFVWCSGLTTDDKEMAMHTTNCGNVWFVHDGDYIHNDSEIIIRKAGRDCGYDEMRVPFGALKTLVANAVAAERFRKLEQATADEILGIGGPR